MPKKRAINKDMRSFHFEQLERHGCSLLRRKLEGQVWGCVKS